MSYIPSFPYFMDVKVSLPQEPEKKAPLAWIPGISSLAGRTWTAVAPDRSTWKIVTVDQEKPEFMARHYDAKGYLLCTQENDRRFKDYVDAIEWAERYQGGIDSDREDIATERHEREKKLKAGAWAKIGSLLCDDESEKP